MLAAAVSIILCLLLSSGHSFTAQRRTSHSKCRFYSIVDDIRLISNERCNNAVADEVFGWSEDTQRLFLDKYWSKKPLLIRGLVSNVKDDSVLSNIVLPDDLIELSYDDDVESRLIKLVTNSHTKKTKIVKKYGPFEKNDFKILPNFNWTLLVQETDRHIPALADLWEKHFSMFPAWRRDDIMISYAKEGGGIGGHVDNYDVFLLQGMGQRVWSIENAFLTDEQEKAREIPNTDTRLLSGFRDEQSFTLRAGDALYLPPRVPHKGVSISDHCVTVSFGFRAPTYRSILTAFTENICQTAIKENEFYSDYKFGVDDNDGISNINNKAITRISATLKERIKNVMETETLFHNFIGQYLTTPLRMQVNGPAPFFLEKSGVCEDFDEECMDDDFVIPNYAKGKHSIASTNIFRTALHVYDAFTSGQVSLRRAEGIKVAYICTRDEANVFINGAMYSVRDENTAVFLCDYRNLRSDLFNKSIKESSKEAFKASMISFLKEGFYYPCEEETRASLN